MNFDCTIKHTAGRDNNIVDVPFRVHKYLVIYTTKDNFIPYIVDSTTIGVLHEITRKCIWASDRSARSFPTSNQCCYNVPACRGIKFTHVACNLYKYRGRAESTGPFHSCPYLIEENMELTSEADYELIRKEVKELSAKEEPLSSILEELLEKYKASSTNINIIDAYYILQVVLSQTRLPFCHTMSSPVAMGNDILDDLIKILEGTEKPILIPNSQNLLSNKELAAIIRNATKKVGSKLETVHTKSQQHRCQQ